MAIFQERIICISHGSGGFSETEKYIGDCFKSAGYQVMFNNYLENYNIKKINWHTAKHVNDNYNIGLKQICKLTLPKNTSIIHIGFSLGGYIGLVNSNKFIKNYCFYPGILPFHFKIKHRNFSNTTLFLPDDDNWCINTDKFLNQLIIPPARIILKDTKHGFMSLNKNRTFEVLTYDFPIFVDYTELKEFVFDHSVLMSKYIWKYKNVNLLSDEKQLANCIDYILEDINK